MYPLLKTGFKIKIIPTAASTLACGQLFVFENQGLICHRLLKKTKLLGHYWLIHRGDNSRAGGVCGDDDLIGAVSEIRDSQGEPVVEPAGGQAVDFCPTGVFLWLYILSYIFKRKFFRFKHNKVIRTGNDLYWKLISF